jgi:hypothetical protein
LLDCFSAFLEGIPCRDACRQSYQKLGSAFQRSAYTFDEIVPCQNQKLAEFKLLNQETS